MNDKLDRDLEEDVKSTVLAEGKTKEESEKVDTKDEKGGDEKDYDKGTEKVDVKKDDEDKDGDDKKEIDTDKVKESYQDRDQPKVQDTGKDGSKEVPAGKVADDKEDPYIAGKDATKEVPAGKVSDNKDTPYMKNTAKLAKESVEKMFEGAESLSDDFMEKATTIFEAAFNDRLKEAVKAIRTELEEEFETKYTELEEKLSNDVSDYVDYVTEEWVKQNEVALTHSLKAEICESFINDFKELFEKHNITIPDDKVDLLEEAQTEIEELKEHVKELTESNIEKSKAIFESAKEKAVAELSEGLAATQAEKFSSLVEDVEAKDIDTFKSKAKTIRESYFKKEEAKAEEGETVALNEENDGEKAEKKETDKGKKEDKKAPPEKK